MTNGRGKESKYSLDFIRIKQVYFNNIEEVLKSRDDILLKDKSTDEKNIDIIFEKDNLNYYVFIIYQDYNNLGIKKLKEIINILNEKKRDYMVNL